MTGDQRRTLWTVAGALAGLATGLWLWRRAGEGEPVPGIVSTPGDAAARIARAFDRDPELKGRGLAVHAVSSGVVELTGMVAHREQRERVVAMAHNTPGVHTVVNRLLLESEEARLQENRARHEDDHAGRQHYGMGVGMGTRRQSPDTDPDRPSDKQKLVDRELDVGRVEADLPEADLPEPADEEGPETEPGAPGA